MADDREGRGRPLKPPPGKKGAARLSHEERALWEHTAASLQPIKGKKGRVHASLEDNDGEPGAGKRETAKPAPPKRPPAVAPPPPHKSKVTLPPPAPAPIALERRKARKLSSGRIEIDGRIDLHGMRQSDAHVRLRAFLLDAHARGLKTVLVITGKGGEQPKDDYMVEAFGQQRRGVLRRNVPIWLDEPELRAVVVGYTPAGVRHGGEGALYVQLRRSARRGDGDV